MLYNSACRTTVQKQAPRIAQALTSVTCTTNWQNVTAQRSSISEQEGHLGTYTECYCHVTLHPMEFKTVQGENRIDIKVCTKNGLRCLSNNRRNIWLKIIKWMLSLGSCSVDGYYNYNGFWRSVLWQELSQKMISHVFLKWP